MINHHFPLIVCANNDSTWLRFRDTTRFTVYKFPSVTLRSPSFFQGQLKLRDTRAFRLTRKHFVDNTCYMGGVTTVSNSNSDLNVAQGHWKWHHLTGHTRLPVSLPLQLII